KVGCDVCLPMRTWPGGGGDAGGRGGGGGFQMINGALSGVGPGNTVTSCARAPAVAPHVRATAHAHASPNRVRVRDRVGWFPDDRPGFSIVPPAGSFPQGAHAARTAPVVSPRSPRRAGS